MTTEYRRPNHRDEISKSPKGLRIDFSEFKSIRISHSIESCYLTGQMSSSHKIKGNIIGSEIFKLHSENIDWRRNDVKDCLIKSSLFKKSNLNVSALMNNVISDCVYDCCTFYDATMTDTVFDRVKFRHCDLSGLVIKRCTFIGCTFASCVTNNKLIEHCVLDQTRFVRTEIRLSSIVDNYGLTQDLFVGGGVEIEEKMLNKRQAIISLKHLLTDIYLTPLEKLKVKYFVEGNLEGCADELDAALQMNTWIPLCRIPSTFSYLLAGFSTFLINQYESNQLPLSPLLRLYYATTQMDRQPSHNLLMSDFQANLSAASMKLLPYFENFLILLEDLSHENYPNARFLTPQTMSREYYDQFFSKTLSNRGIVIKEIVPGNSPAELWLFCQDHACFAALLSVFLASRIKLEITSLKKSTLLKSRGSSTEDQRIIPSIEPPKGESSDQTDLVPVRGKYPQRLSFELGTPPEGPLTYQLKIYALFPERIAINLQLEMKLGVIYKIRMLLLDLLKPHRANEVSSVH
jgi:hypothetical protein